MVVIVIDKESATWKVASMKTLSRDDQLKYIVVERMRIGKVGKVGKVGKLENFKTDKEERNQDEENCASRS